MTSFSMFGVDSATLSIGTLHRVSVSMVSDATGAGSWFRPIELSRRFNKGYQEDEELQEQRRTAKSELIPAAAPHLMVPEPEHDRRGRNRPLGSVTIILSRREDLKLKAK
jgi:hypothetical protein